ncbi:MAG TPA: hypothetical protein DEB39_09485 [Planctomycetaceae bacterium]|nr:hypothetical protein [Planctomycetaceae bacterium]
MKRRDFLSTAAVAAVSATTAGSAEAQMRKLGNRKESGRSAAETPRQFIELRTYRVAGAEKKAQLVECLDRATVPALNRMGIKPVGVFTVFEDAKKSDPGFANAVFLVIPHETPKSFIRLNARLLADKTYRKDSAAILDAPIAERAYEDCESALLYGFPTCPKIEIPTRSPDRIFQLRFYNSHNFERNAAKIAMFDVAGELKLFRETGIHPVFFGETLFGGLMPNLTYLVAADSPEAMDQSWAAFTRHPEWDKLKNDPAFAETATKILMAVVKPSPGSQI